MDKDKEIIDDPPSDGDFCGVGKLSTGSWDPLWKQACQPHDWAYDQMMQGLNSTPADNLKTQGAFIKNVGLSMLKAAYTLVAGPIYIALGVGIGAFRWMFLVDKDSAKGQDQDETKIQY